MAQTEIEWTMRCWNPTTGCNKVSQGCKFCYAEIMHRRLQGMAKMKDKYFRNFLDGAFEHEPSLYLPLSWKKGQTVFLDSMSDLFHKNISVEYIAKVYAIMFITPQHTYQILTKRPERRLEVFKSTLFFEYLHKYCNQYHDKYIKLLESEMYFFDEIKSLFPFDNIWEGTSTEDQEQANIRIPLLLQTPAALRWISAEPLLGRIDFAQVNELCAKAGIDTTKSRGLDWVVTGGESGHSKRRFDCDWAREMRDYCKNAGIKFFMKQVDKVQSIPDDLLIRQYPKIKTPCLNQTS